MYTPVLGSSGLNTPQENTEFQYIFVWETTIPVVFKSRN